MKKLCFGVLAIAMMVGCAKDQVIRTQAPAHITFENAFVQGVGSSASRAAADPSFTTNSTNAIDAFDVWGLYGCKHWCRIRQGACYKDCR